MYPRLGNRDLKAGFEIEKKQTNIVRRQRYGTRHRSSPLAHDAQSIHQIKSTKHRQYTQCKTPRKARSMSWPALPTLKKKEKHVGIRDPPGGGVLHPQPTPRSLEKGDTANNRARRPNLLPIANRETERHPCWTQAKRILALCLPLPSLNPHAKHPRFARNKRDKGTNNLFRPVFERDR